MRTSSLALLLTLAACAKQPEAPQNLQQTRPLAAHADPVEHIACAYGDAPLARACTLDRERTAAGEIWTIRHPDGSFRRLVVKGDEIETADGAQLLHASGGDMVVGGERYRLQP